LENEKILKNDPYCILIQDNAESFTKSLLQMKEVLAQNPGTDYFSSRYNQYSWEYIVKKDFIPLIKEIK